jgi:7-keto-8-aminopelargonate synthetase-like enzyme
LIEFLVNRARSFIFSTAPVPAAAAAAGAAIELVGRDEGERRCQTLWERVDQLTRELSLAGGSCSTARSAVIPLRIGDEIKAVEAAAALRNQGVFVPAIRFPTVARGAARLRLAVTATHTANDLKQLLRAIASAERPGTMRTVTPAWRACTCSPTRL